MAAIMTTAILPATIASLLFSGLRAKTDDTGTKRNGKENGTNCIIWDLRLTALAWGFGVFEAPQTLNPKP